MPLDALALACVVHELRQATIPARIQQALLSTERTVALELYAAGQRRYLLMHVQGPDCWLTATEAKPRRGDRQTSSFLELLRKYARGGRLTVLHQPDPTERIVVLHVEHPQHGATRLWLELTGRQSNLLLVGNEDRLMGQLHPGSRRAPRSLRPGHAYSPPPRPARLSPLTCTAEQAAEALRGDETPEAAQALTRAFAGVGPVQAREIAWRVTGRVEARTAELDAEALIRTLRALWQPVTTGRWAPSLVQRPGQAPILAPFALRHVPQAQPLSSLHAAVAERIPSDPYRDARLALQRRIRKALAQGQRRLRATRQDMPADGAAERLRLQGHWLLALQHSVTPGQRTLTVPDESGMEIRLQPPLAPVQQAEQMFKRARKMDRAARILPERLQQVRRDLAYLAQLELDLATAANRTEIEAVRGALETSGLAKSPAVARRPAPAPRAVGGPRRFACPEGFSILVGRNARQNAQLTFKQATPRDLWLHVKEAPGSHVVIRAGGQPVSPDTLRAAAQLAAFYSQRRGESDVPVIVAEKRHVLSLARGRPGQVRLRQGQGAVISAPARLPALEELP